MSLCWLTIPGPLIESHNSLNYAFHTILTMHKNLKINSKINAWEYEKYYTYKNSILESQDK